MGWVNGFELMCYLLSAVLVADIARRKSLFEAKLFASGAIAGYALELLAVRVTDIYYYNPAFWLNLGFEPYQFPAFGGLMWGGLTVCAVRLAKRLGLGRATCALASGFLIVSMDLLLDVAAIRLDGGFWTWAGRPITTDVTHHMFMSVIWVNFLGYLFETPAIVWLALRDDAKPPDRPPARHVLACLANALGGICFVGVASLASLWLDSVTDEWFSCLAFLAPWLFVLARITVRLATGKPRLSPHGQREWLAIAFFAAMYAYCFLGLHSLGIFAQHGWFLALGIVLLVLTCALGVVDLRDSES